MLFFERNISQYDYNAQPLCFVGSTCVAYKPILLKAADDFGVEVSKVIRYSMPGIVEYHADKTE